MGRPPFPYLLAALIEHESCISLTHSKCWNPKSSLKTAREEGAGLGQITRAYRPDGTLRFDSLAEMRRKYPLELGDLNWYNVYERPDLQIRAIILMLRDNYKLYENNASSPLEAYAFTDASYNGGTRDLNLERRACKMISDCDPSKWFGNVEKYCMKSKVALYGKRSACDINRHHVTDVINKRGPKYKPLF